jgi:phage tail P2-like protein
MTSVATDEGAHLLPPNASALERVFSASAARINAIPVPIDLLKRPYEVPAAFLPHLAWEVSLDVWFNGWPEWRKRRAVAKSIGLHYLKGTLPGIEGWLDLIGATVRVAHIPPVAAYVSANRTPEQKRRFAEQFPELRIYTKSEIGSAGADLHADHGFVDFDFATVSTARDRYGRRAYLTDRGATRSVPMLPVTWAGAEAILAGLDGVVIPGEDDGGFFLGDAAAGLSYATAAKITSRLLAIAADRSYLPVSPQPVLLGGAEPLSLIDVLPERVAVKGTIGPDVLHASAGFVGDYLGAKDAHLRIFDRYYVFDPDRVERAGGTDGGFFLDHSRLSIPPFHAEFRISYPGTAPEQAFVADDAFLGEACLVPVLGQMDEVAAVLRTAKALRDDVWFTTRTSRPLEFNDLIAFDGSARFGAETQIYD